MNKYRLKYLATAIAFLMLGYTFSGGDCGTDDDSDPPATSVAAPANVRLVLDWGPSSPFAIVKWDHSADQNRSDFRGYKVTTYEVDSLGSIISSFRVDNNIPKTSTEQQISSLQSNRRYRSYISAETNNGLRSDSVSTVIYAGVFAFSGTIDEYQATGSAESGFGWDVQIGSGIQYAYTGGNAASIDLHVRNTGGTGLQFYSPAANPPGTKTTLFGLIGQGQTAFDQTALNEPTATSIPVIDENVYLLKLESGHYVKIWVTEITNTSGFQTIQFEYKLQPIAGLRVLKR